LLLFHELPVGERQRLLRRICRRAATKGLLVIDESRGAVRAHNLRELRRALLKRTPMILLSPLYSTQSHPSWRPIPRMRAAAYARLAGSKLVALGGMDERRFRRWSRLGFIGWAGISAFRT
jgi:thiamine-phosphate pyrophosphorylase